MTADRAETRHLSDRLKHGWRAEGGIALASAQPMRFHALACDYDRTLANDSHVDAATRRALSRVRQSGRRLVLVTGRELDDLTLVFPDLDCFDRIVAENGALLYDPATQESRPLAGPPAEAFVSALRARGVSPLAVGRAIVATCEPHETAVLEVIREHGLELQLIFNRGAVMVLPSGINKATGLAVALRELGLSPRNCVGIGDAENDHAFLSLCECAVAVGDAVPAIREGADLVTRGGAGAGVIELVEALLASDLAGIDRAVARREVLLGTTAEGAEIRFDPQGANLLVVGPSGSGKSTLATAVLERLGDAGYQFCIVDPEGAYRDVEGAIVLGETRRAPTLAEVLDVLAAPDRNVVVNLADVPRRDRPGFLAALLPRFRELRGRMGRPHWILVDEAHHFWSTAPVHAAPTPLDAPSGLILVTAHPEHVAPAVLGAIGVIIAVGHAPGDVIREFARAIGVDAPEVPDAGEQSMVVWLRPASPILLPLAIPTPGAERRRQLRTYATGDLGESESFYFRGPAGKLNLRAYNLTLFVELAEGVDEETWRFHLRQGHYSRWFRDAIEDPDLAAEVERVEATPDVPGVESLKRIRHAIEERYPDLGQAPRPGRAPRKGRRGGAS
ncbi:MAG TPA: HAD-IIB family hydrolase [Candidatus Binatia bacterium]|nr:HAD-IIB family hydrolase [Candidatus Binatia bacterium]